MEIPKLAQGGLVKQGTTPLFGLHDSCETLIPIDSLKLKWTDQMASKLTEAIRTSGESPFLITIDAGRR